jgi:hypothetical protein
LMPFIDSPDRLSRFPNEFAAPDRRISVAAPG